MTAGARRGDNRAAPRYFVGVDPGVNGGIAVLDLAGQVVDAARIPPRPSELVAHFRRVPTPCVALLEFVRSRPRMASGSVFTFGRGYGRLEVALAAAGIPYEAITPQKWQAFMQCMSAGDKRVTKARAQELFPGVTVTHAIADALLLAECCRQLRKGSTDGEE